MRMRGTERRTRKSGSCQRDIFAGKGEMVWKGKNRVGVQILVHFCALGSGRVTKCAGILQKRIVIMPKCLESTKNITHFPAVGV